MSASHHVPIVVLLLSLFFIEANAQERPLMVAVVGVPHQQSHPWVPQGHAGHQQHNETSDQVVGDPPGPMNSYRYSYRTRGAGGHAGRNTNDGGERPLKHSMSLEGAGIGGIASINYERNFHRRENRFTTFRIGLGVSQLIYVPSLPHGITINFGRGKNFLETGLLGSLGATTFGYADAPASLYFFAPTIGYRRQPVSGLFFRIYFSTYISVAQSPEVIPGIGIGLGYTFKKEG